MKKCELCEIERSEHDFYTGAYTDDHLSSQCKRCCEKSANPERGDREDFLSLTIRMSPELYFKIKQMSNELRCGGRKDSDFSAIIRRLLVRLL